LERPAPLALPLCPWRINPTPRTQEDTDMSTLPEGTTTLIGFLGKNRIERVTRDQTRTIQFADPILDGELVEREITIPGRPYLKLSLATHEAQGTRWHDLIVWSPDLRTNVRNAYLARTGDKVRVTGRFEDYSFTTESGDTLSGSHFVVDDFHFERIKSRQVS
jgi:single-stranded DNA-binding protein